VRRDETQRYRLDDLASVVGGYPVNRSGRDEFFHKLLGVIINLRPQVFHFILLSSDVLNMVSHFSDLVKRKKATELNSIAFNPVPAPLG
jgi:hypothetical protein